MKKKLTLQEAADLSDRVRSMTTLLNKVDWLVFGTLVWPTPIQDQTTCTEIFKRFLRCWEVEIAIGKGVAQLVHHPKTKLRGVWVNASKCHRASARHLWLMVVEPRKYGKLNIHFVIQPSKILEAMDEAIGKKMWKELTKCSSNIYQDPRCSTAASDFIAKRMTSNTDIFFSASLPKTLANESM